MKRRLRIGCALAVAVFVAVTASAAVAAEKTYYFSGKTDTAGHGAVTHNVKCADGYYVKNSGTGSETVFDEPYIDKHPGTSEGVTIDTVATSSAAWGHAFSRLVTGMKVVLGNSRSYRGQSLPYGVTVMCTNKEHDAWAILGSSRRAPTSTVETTYTFNGDTKRNGGGTPHNVECASGHYIKSDGINPGTIADGPFIDKSGSADGVGVEDRATSSVAWGHIGSRLATGIELWVQNEPTRTRRSLPYRVTVKCTDNRQDAWIIFG